MSDGERETNTILYNIIKSLSIISHPAGILYNIQLNSIRLECACVFWEYINSMNNGCCCVGDG